MQVQQGRENKNIIHSHRSHSTRKATSKNKHDKQEPTRLKRRHQPAVVLLLYVPPLLHGRDVFTSGVATSCHFPTHKSKWVTGSNPGRSDTRVPHSNRKTSDPYTSTNKGMHRLPYPRRLLRAPSTKADTKNTEPSSGTKMNGPVHTIHLCSIHRKQC